MTYQLPRQIKLIKMPCFVLTPWPPLSDGTPSDSPLEMGRRGEPWRNHYDFSGCFRTPFEFPLGGEKRETGMQRKGTKKANKEEISLNRMAMGKKGTVTRRDLLSKVNKFLRAFVSLCSYYKWGNAAGAALGRFL